MWFKKRQRYVFRKHSRRGRVLWPVVGTLILVGLVWLIPWQAISSVGVGDTLRSEAAEDQSEQGPVVDQPEQSSAEDQSEQASAEGQSEHPDAQDQTEQLDAQNQPEQADISEQPSKEADLGETPPKAGGAQNNLTSLSSPPAQAAQLSPPSQAPSTSGMREVAQDSEYSNYYWSYPNYYCLLSLTTGILSRATGTMDSITTTGTTSQLTLLRSKLRLT